jgi:hypothetical protein
VEVTACLPVNDVGEACAGEPHARFDRGPLAMRETHGETEHAPEGKPDGLSPSDLPATDQPAAYLTSSHHLGVSMTRCLGDRQSDP